MFSSEKNLIYHPFSQLTMMIFVLPYRKHLENRINIENLRQPTIETCVIELDDNAFESVIRPNRDVNFHKTRLYERTKIELNHRNSKTAAQQQNCYCFWCRLLFWCLKKKANLGRKCGSCLRKDSRVSSTSGIARRQLATFGTFVKKEGNSWTVARWNVKAFVRI